MRFIAAITIGVLATLVPWYVLMLLALFYVLRYSAFELIFIAFFIDAFFGNGHVLPYYTVTMICLLGASLWLKPRLLAYNG